MKFIAIEPDIGAASFYRIGLSVLVIAGGTGNLWIADIYATIENANLVLGVRRAEGQAEKQKGQASFEVHMLIVF
jgi:hypothetical protein